MCKVITTGNFKGGVGKTTNAVMLAYTFAKQGKKTLLVDLDPQANATDLLFNTMKKVHSIEPEFKRTLAMALIDANLQSALINVLPNLDLLPSYEDLQTYEKFLFRNFEDDFSQDTYFAKQLSIIKENYDYIFIDVPPQLNKFADSALVASDYVMVILQTQERSLKGAQKYIEHVFSLADDYNLPLEIIGALPVLMQNGNEIDKDILQEAEEIFGKANVFSNIIKQMARLKRFDRTGITYNLKDVHDKNVHTVYQNIAGEVEKRIEILEGMTTVNG
ncbi:ATPase [Bacillus pseudomycoides]|uniref:ParA family protein n=1 Tax=Bacillus pseudomycoides TaxID=64104 RepID=UPI000BEE50BB|nr:ParA family protein [Bacillus pseudomycoides]PEE42843.1 ATPase [Bacillus pseudomycoides]PEK68655.1 ATPase [Bacillus pseudomycoides]PEM34453.1 ATPase [Bacillus pseudomycoides]PEO48103.1 ATPase [Bacillus pseudomycoides]PEP77209.1 ATPase [Bacillus pseudomycoides]